MTMRVFCGCEIATWQPCELYMQLPIEWAIINEPLGQGTKNCVES
jgi:hypothetical protein